MLRLGSVAHPVSIQGGGQPLIGIEAPTYSTEKGA
jgi:hypothetical protein